MADISDEHRCDIYLLSPPEVAFDTFPQMLEPLLETGKVAAFQLRLPAASDDEILSLAKELAPLCRRYETAFIVNDNLELAKACDADGVHLGQSDQAHDPNFIRSIRQKMGDEFVIGVSCYDSRDAAMQAGEEGADYVSFGAFYPTKTKETTAQPSPNILTWWHVYTTLPCVAIGGINAQNCQPLIQAGTDFIAVVSSVWDHPEGPLKGLTLLYEAKEVALSEGLELSLQASS